ncbi:hypothetical protein Ahy_A09g045058 [Arachis hypogaea]|uniref:PB1-like domain-containing protein n=1 Tax=Arachis hypogaea TaxID=3818 RepID=A0A445BLF6_ARAHY|nr:hypothetical protein Ahy_A09g045058 [Arachis hypogaea]
MKTTTTTSSVSDDNDDHRGGLHDKHKDDGGKEWRQLGVDDGWSNTPNRSARNSRSDRFVPTKFNKDFDPEVLRYTQIRPHVSLTRLGLTVTSDVEVKGITCLVNYDVSPPGHFGPHTSWIKRRHIGTSAETTSFRGGQIRPYLGKISEDVVLVFHHGESFVRDNKGVLVYINRNVKRFPPIDVDLIYFFDLKKIFLELRYHNYKAMYWVEEILSDSDKDVEEVVVKDARKDAKTKTQGKRAGDKKEKSAVRGESWPDVRKKRDGRPSVVGLGRDKPRSDDNNRPNESNENAPKKPSTFDEEIGMKPRDDSDIDFEYESEAFLSSPDSSDEGGRI